MTIRAAIAAIAVVAGATVAGAQQSGGRAAYVVEWRGPAGAQMTADSAACHARASVLAGSDTGAAFLAEHRRCIAARGWRLVRRYVDAPACHPVAIEWVPPLPPGVDSAALDYLARTLADSLRRIVPTEEDDRAWRGRIAFQVRIGSLGPRDIAAFENVRVVGEPSSDEESRPARHVKSAWPLSMYVRVRDRIRARRSVGDRLAKAVRDHYKVGTLLLVADGVAAFRAECVTEAPVTEGEILPVTSESRPSETPYFEFQVEKPAAPMPGNPSPRHPDALRSANVEGEVLVQFVVNTDGRPDVSTFKVLRSSHGLFTEAVRAVLPEMRFYAAEIDGRKVRQLVQMPFQFTGR